MDKHSMDHVSTLAALGTVGVGAAGLAFGFEEHAFLETKPGPKRKAHTSGTLEPQRAVSQPEKIIQNRPQSRPGLPVPLFRRKTYQDSERLSTTSSTSTTSRQSSPFGRHRLQSRSGEDDTPTDRRDGRPMAWLRRMSSLGGSPASSIRPTTPSMTMSHASDTPMWSSEESQLAPNKLVKRSSSHRLLSADHAQLPALRRPATSHQRTATVQQLSSQPVERVSENLLPPPSEKTQVWMPYFSNGDVALRGIRPRKRHTSGALDQNTLRIVSDAPGRRPTLVLGTAVEPRPETELDDLSTKQRNSSPPPVRQRLRYSLSNARRGVKGGKRRNMTDPIKQGGFPADTVPFSSESSISPMSHMSPFEVQMPKGTPSYPSSPWQESHRVVSAPAARLSHSKRVSVAPSDPNSANLSSDNDTRVFTDDESYEFQSDTAYDSLATRATASSHSGLKGQQIETIFDESPPSDPPRDPVTLQDLIRRGTLDAGMDQDTHAYPVLRGRNVGIGITGWDDDDHAMEDAENGERATPVKSGALNEDEDLATPMTVVRHRYTVDMKSSPPILSRPLEDQDEVMDGVQHSIAAMTIDHNTLDWDRTTDPESTFDEAFSSPDLPRHSASIGTSRSPNFENPSMPVLNSQHVAGGLEKRNSIFDWSERHRFEDDSTNGSSPRPKTVHGKQGLDGRGSRAPGRRGPSAVHLRSQSVPVNRESTADGDSTQPIAKFGTWGLGNKGVSEEWNDDFEFDDLEDAMDIETDAPMVQNGTLRGMKVPQAIIDRQDSVHGQFGQVQEFMLLVEDLKRMRVQGGQLGLLESQSRQLWEDAESIINLATLNDDDDGLYRPQSPTFAGSFDDFDEDSPRPSHTSTPKAKIDETKRRNSINRRSISSPATPPPGRPRGESLAQAKNFLQTIHQDRIGPDSSPAEEEIHREKKLPFDTQDLRDLVARAGTINRALKEILRKAEGLSLSPAKMTPKRFQDPAFNQIFIPPEENSPTPTFKKPALPKSRSANSYLGSPVHINSTSEKISEHMKTMTVV